MTGGAVLAVAALCAPPAPAQGAPTPFATDRAATPDAALQGAFALGLALLDAGRARDAARLFSTILAEDPGNTRVRLELARAHFQSRQWSRARAEFLSVLSGDIPDPVRANVLRFLRAIDARRGVDWDVDVALVTLGDTRDHDSDTIFVNGLPFTLDGRDGETARGLRHALGVTLSRDIPHRSGGRARALAFGRLAAAGDEGPGARFDDLTLTAEAGVRLSRPRATLTVAPSVSRRFLAGSVFEDRTGLRAAFEHRSPSGTTLALSAAWQDIDNREDARDGHMLRVGLSVGHPVTPRTSLGLEMMAEDRDASSPADDFRRTRLTVSGAFDAGRGIALRPGLWLERKTVARPGPAVADETGRGIALTVESDRIVLPGGFTPYARIEAARTTSDIEAFAYRDITASIGLTRRF